jgi:predicted GIY-YIG superfamily endonuclease
MKHRRKEGYVYVITNSNFPGYVKVGVTEDITSRLRTYQTASPYRNYKLEHYIFHPDCYTAESEIHDMMTYFATARGKGEWFKIDLDMAKTRLDETLLEK